MSNPEWISIKPIGHIESPFKQKFGTPRQAALVPHLTAKLIFDASILPDGALEGLELCSHLWVLFWFHKNRPSNSQGKVKPPRMKGKKMGVLATRSPHHPNDLGMSLCQIRSIDFDSREIEVSGLDVIDKTPIVDIKPYISAYDSIQGARDPWSQQPETLFCVQFSEASLRKLESLPEAQELRSLIDSSLCRDIRSLEDQKKSDPHKVFKTQLLNWDVHFSYQNESVIVTDLLRPA